MIRVIIKEVILLNLGMTKMVVVVMMAMVDDDNGDDGCDNNNDDYEDDKEDADENEKNSCVASQTIELSKPTENRDQCLQCELEISAHGLLAEA